MEEIGYTRQTQKLIHWLINDYACFLEGSDPGITAHELTRHKAKTDLKKLYLKHCGINISKFKPFNDFKENLSSVVVTSLVKENKKDAKVEMIVDATYNYVLTEFKKLILVLDGTFSLSLDMLTQKKANEFVSWLFEFCLSKGIPLREEIINKFQESDFEKFTYIMLKLRKCVICGKKADLHHWDSVNSIGGYKQDDGLKTRFLPLCREHHQEFHSIEVKAFEIKYLVSGIKLNEEQVKELKKIYKGHFKAAV